MLASDVALNLASLYHKLWYLSALKECSVPPTDADVSAQLYPLNLSA